MAWQSSTDFYPRAWTFFSSFQGKAARHCCGIVFEAMAAYIRRPLARTILSPSRCLFQTRHYRASPMADDARMQPQPSMKVAMKQNVDLPTDLGLLAGECQSSTFRHRQVLTVDRGRHIHHAHRRQQTLHPLHTTPSTESRMATHQSPRGRFRQVGPSSCCRPLHFLAPQTR